jgi:pyrroline-5-carboxylate reductase
MAAGISIDGVKKISGLDLPVIRIMPNTPCQIGKGVVLCSYSDGVTDSDKKAFLTALAGAGFVDEIPEDKIDAGSVVSGCGPAFVYMYINALKNAGVSCGLSDDKALSYAIKTVIGSAEMVTASTEDISTLIKRVCSPGGTTIEGVKSFEEDNLSGVVEKALKASYKRTLELKK